MDDVGVAFHAGHEGRLVQRAGEAAKSAGAGSDGIFPDKNPRPAAAVTVIFGRVGNERGGTGVIVHPEFPPGALEGMLPWSLAMRCIAG